VVGDMVKNFEKPPYGWKDISTLDVLLQLAKKGFRRFEWRGEEVDLKTYAEKAVNTKERFAITIHKEKVHSTQEVTAFIQAVNDVFNETVIPSNLTDFKEAVEILRNKLKPKITRINKLKDEYDGYVFSLHLKKYFNALDPIFTTRSDDDLMQMVLNQKTQLIQLRDKYKMLEEFIDNNIQTYQEIVEFVSQNKNNFSSLDEHHQVRGIDLSDYLQTDDEPWEKFPQMKKAYKELHQAIHDHLNQVREMVIDAYGKIFDEIESRRRELQIEDNGIVTDKSSYLQKIRKESQITKLQLYLLEANEFRANNLKSLEDYQGKKKAEKKGVKYEPAIPVSIVNEMDPITIETPEQLDDYINELREKLMIQLKENKKLYLK